MEYKPCAVIASCTDTHPKEIIKLILGVDDLPEPRQLEDGINAYPWTIDTKYYTAEVFLCAIDKKTLGSEQFAMSVEAAVINFDNNRNDGLEVVGSWLSFLKEFEPEVQILLCKRCEEDPATGIAKINAHKWCIERGFELVELNPEIDTEWEAEQDFIETTGIPRVVQALHSHLWPNLVMKGKSTPLSRSVHSMLNAEAENEPDTDRANQEVEEKIDEALGDSGAIAGFSSLFERLHEMKDEVADMPSDRRKAAAEQVVMAFWRAIGGDDDEIEGLTDSG